MYVYQATLRSYSILSGDDPVWIIQIETNTFEFRNPTLERLIALTPADRKWMDEIVKDVNDSWNQDQTRPSGLA